STLLGAGDNTFCVVAGAFVFLWDLALNQESSPRCVALATASTPDETLSLREIDCNWVLSVLTVTNRFLAASALVRPRASCLRTSNSRLVNTATCSGISVKNTEGRVSFAGHSGIRSSASFLVSGLKNTVSVVSSPVGRVAAVVKVRKQPG